MVRCKHDFLRFSHNSVTDQMLDLIFTGGYASEAGRRNACFKSSQPQLVILHLDKLTPGSRLLPVVAEGLLAPKQHSSSELNHELRVSKHWREKWFQCIGEVVRNAAA